MGTPFGADRDFYQQLFRAAGFEDVSVDVVTLDIEVADVPGFVRDHFASLPRPITKEMQASGTEAQRRAQDHTLALLEPYLTNGKGSLPWETLVVSAVR